MLDNAQNKLDSANTESKKILKEAKKEAEKLVIEMNDKFHKSSEIKIINEFLPKQLGDEETKKICLETIKSVGASSVKDMGKVMGVLKKKYSDVLDFSKVSGIIKGLLN